MEIYRILQRWNHAVLPQPSHGNPKRYYFTQPKLNIFFKKLYNTYFFKFFLIE